MVIPPTGLSGDPGDNITYLFHIQNMGSEADNYSYMVETNISTWYIAGADNGTVGRLAPGEISGSINVTHHVYWNATASETCILLFTVWSETAGFSVNSSGFTVTTANPMSAVSVDPPSGDHTAYPGENSTLVFNVTNRGNWDDSFLLSVSTQYTWHTYVAKEIFVKRGESAPCAVYVTIPNFEPKWSDADFAKNGTFYNSKGLVTLTATGKFIPSRSSASAKIRILPYYQAGLSAQNYIASVDPYNFSSENVNNKAYYLLKVHNMNNYPTRDKGSAVITLAVTPPVSTPGTPEWSVQLIPPSPYTIDGRSFSTVIVIVTEPPGQESGDYITTIIGSILPQTGSVSDPVETSNSEIQLHTVVGIQGGVDVTCTLPDKRISLVVTQDSFSLNFTVNNFGSGKDTFRLNATTTHGWVVKIRNETSLDNPCDLTVERNPIPPPTVELIVDVPDGVTAGASELVTLTAVSRHDALNGTDSDTANVTIINLYRIKITKPDVFLPIGPGLPLDVPYRVSNFGSNAVTVRVSYSRDVNSSIEWGIPSEGREWSMKPNTTRDESFLVTPPADPAWHENFTAIVLGEVVDNDAVVATTELNVTLQARMFLFNTSDQQDEMTSSAVPGESITYYLNAWNLAETGPANLTVRVESLPVGWDGYFMTGGSPAKVRTGFDSPILMPFSDTFDFNFTLVIPKDAEERDFMVIELSARNVINGKQYDTVRINVTLVVLDLSVDRVTLSAVDFRDNEEYNITAEISAGANGVGISKDATHVEVVFTVTADGYLYTRTETIDVIPKGTTVNVTISWKVPKLAWFERARDYRVTANASTPDESPGANLANNAAAYDLSVKHDTIPSVLSIGVMVSCALLIVVIFIFVKDTARLRRVFKLLTFALISLLLGALLASIFLLPLGPAGVPVLFVLLLVPVPAFTLYSYLKSKSVFTGLIAGIITPCVFGIVVGAGSGRLDYIASVFTESAGGVQAAYSLYTAAIIVMALVFGLLTRWLWTHASREILKVELKIKDLKRAE
jgi:hypothetical protein